MVPQTSGGSRRPWGRVLLLLVGAAGLALAAGGGAGRPPVRRPPSLTTVLLSSRALGPSERLTAQDLRSVRVAASLVTASVPADPMVVLGRRLRVAVGPATPILEALLAPPESASPLRRVVPLTIPVEHLAPRLAPGQEVDVVAAEAAVGAGSGGRVEVAGGGELLSVSSSASATPSTPGGGADAIVVLSCDEPTAMRLLWAQSFARSLTVVARPAGSRPLPGTGDAGPATAP